VVVGVLAGVGGRFVGVGVRGVGRGRLGCCWCVGICGRWGVVGVGGCDSGWGWWGSRANYRSGFIVALRKCRGVFSVVGGAVVCDVWCEGCWVGAAV